MHVASLMSMAGIGRSRKRRYPSTIEPSRLATASMTCARCAIGALIDETRHLARLGRSLEAVRISWPIGEAALRLVMRETVRRNRVRDGLVYIQISRGAARRDHGFPSSDVKPGLVVAARALDPRDRFGESGQRRRRHHLARSAMGASAHQDACNCCRTYWPSRLRARRGRSRPGLSTGTEFVTEGASTNAWIVTPDAAIVTRQADESILHGVARARLLDVARLSASFEKRPFTTKRPGSARSVPFQRDHHRHASRVH